MTGIEIGSGTLNKEGVYSIEFKGLKNVGAVSGLTNLANAWVFFLLSSFNSVTNVGSNLTKHIKDGILFKRNMEATIIEIEDDIKDAEKRFKDFQGKSLNISDEEKMETVKILGINIDAQTQMIKIDMNIRNILGVSAGVRVNK